MANPDIFGSREFACHIAGAKVALVLGHSSCGAVVGAIDGVELGQLTGLLNRIKPAVAETSYDDGPPRSSDVAFVERVARTNVERTIGVIPKESAILRELERNGAIAIAGAMYDLKTATVSFLLAAARGVAPRRGAAIFGAIKLYQMCIDLQRNTTDVHADDNVRAVRPCTSIFVRSESLHNRYGS